MDPATLFALGSAAAGGLSALTGKSHKWRQLPTRSQEQIAGQSQTLQQALQGLQNPHEGFQPIANQARQQFQSQTVPSIAERFTSLGRGSQGGQRSSAFQGALGQAGAGLESDLAALQSQYGLQNRSQYLQQLGLGLEPSFENVFGGGKSQGSELFGGLSSLLGGLGQYEQQKGLNKQNNQAFFDFLNQYKQATDAGNASGAMAPQQGAKASVQQLMSPQNNLNKYVASGGNQLGGRFFNPMNQGY